MTENEDKRKKFAIFECDHVREWNIPSITFKALPNPTDSNKPLILDAADIDEAVTMATGLIRMTGAITHTTLYAGVDDVPKYFVGELLDSHDSELIYRHFRIHEFVPIPNIEESG